MKRKTRTDLQDCLIDVHTHLGISLKMYAARGYPYAQSAEGLHYRQVANGVDVCVVFPIGPETFLDPVEHAKGRVVPAERPLSPIPYAVENQAILDEVYRFCPELSDGFLPFISTDVGRMVEEQVADIERLAAIDPIYGIKIHGTFCQSPVTELLGKGRPILELARKHDWPILFHTMVDDADPYAHARLCFEVVEACPELRFCLAHGIGFHRGYLDRAAALNNVWVDVAALGIQVEASTLGYAIMATPEERVEADYTDHCDVFRRLVEAYPTTMLWATDSPFYNYFEQTDDPATTYSLKSTYEREKAALDALPDPLKRQVSTTNTLDFLFGRE